MSVYLIVPYSLSKAFFMKNKAGLWIRKKDVSEGALYCLMNRKKEILKLTFKDFLFVVDRIFSKFTATIAT